MCVCVHGLCTVSIHYEQLSVMFRLIIFHSWPYPYPLYLLMYCAQDIPPLESCDLPFPEGGQLVVVGEVSHITEELAVIRAYPDTPPVDEGTVLWSAQKKSLSVVCCGHCVLCGAEVEPQ